jgi:GTP-binding protein YchF
VGPKEDLETIRTELELADLATLSKQSQPKGAVTTEAKERWETITKFKTAIHAGTMINTLELDEHEKLVAKELNLLTAKAEIFAINVDEDQLAHSEQQSAHSEMAKKLGVDEKQIVMVSAKIESELSTLAEADQLEYMKELGITKSGLERLAETAYRTLNLQSFLTAGELEVRAWTIKQGTTAPNAAGAIHTDFTKKFIKANVVHYEDFIHNNGWKGVREAGKLRIEGKEYVMQDGDVVEFMIGS